MKTYGRITSKTVPTFADAVECDLETGSHAQNNAASEAFAKTYPTVLAVGLEQQQQIDKAIRLIDRFADLIKTQLQEQGGCDHSVGICACKEIQLLDEAKEFITNNEP